MKGRTFETFEVTAGNREAYERCRRIALLEEMGPTLLLLLGPEDCGKSHLLWSVAKQVRLSTIPVGLALITPQDFPDKVKDLVEDSRPLQGRRAVLLVDNLEGFEPEGRRLEAVIETFLNHQHPVLVASNVNPNRLQKLSGPLRAKFARSQSIVMEPRVLDGASPMATFEKFQALEQAIARLEEERDALKSKLGVAFASAEDLAAETVALKGRVAELEAEADHAMAQQARAQMALSAVKFQLEELSGLPDVLTERERALAAAEKCVAGALVRLEQMRAAHAAYREELLSDLSAMAEGLAAPENEAPLLRAVAQAGQEQAHIRAALASTRERLKLVEFEWEKSRKVLAIQTAEMDALRYTAAGLVASANIQAGEMEHRIDTVEAALSHVASAAVEVEAALPDAGGVIRTLRAALEHMRTQLAALKAARSASQGDSARAAGEASIFETDFFEVLPEDFQVNMAGAPMSSFPDFGEGLKRAVEGALFPAHGRKAAENNASDAEGNDSARAN